MIFIDFQAMRAHICVISRLFGPPKVFTAPRPGGRIKGVVCLDSDASVFAPGLPARMLSYHKSAWNGLFQGLGELVQGLLQEAVRPQTRIDDLNMAISLLV